MKIIDLPVGERAPDTSDRIVLNALPTGRFDFTGVAATVGTVTMHHASVTYDKVEIAREEGIAWALTHDVETLYVEHPTEA